MMQQEYTMKINYLTLFNKGELGNRNICNENEALQESMA